MSKKNKKAVEQTIEQVTTITPTEESVVVPAESVPVMSKEISTHAKAKAQELLNTAVKDVLAGIISSEALLSIARRKVRQTSVLSEEENEALEKLHIEVKVLY